MLTLMRFLGEGHWKLVPMCIFSGWILKVVTMKRRFEKARSAILTTTVATATLVLPMAAAAATETVDSLIETGTIQNPGTNIISVDYWHFDVSMVGTVTIDVLSHGVLGGDGLDGGTTSGLDPYIWLFAFDAAGDQGMLGATQGLNDDTFLTSLGQADGSISGLDSYLSVDLGIGSYVLALSDWSFSQSEARSGINYDGGFAGSFGDYQITFTGIDVAPVPLPAALPLMLAGMGALGFVGRRRSNKKASA